MATKPSYPTCKRANDALTTCGRSLSERRWSKSWKRTTCRSCKGIRNDELTRARVTSLARAFAILAGDMPRTTADEFRRTVATLPPPPTVTAGEGK